MKILPHISLGKLKDSKLKNIIKHSIEVTLHHVPLIKLRHFNTTLTVSINLISKKQIKEINQRFRCKDKATDVLAFSLIIQGMNHVFDSNLGDILICAPIAKAQAKDSGITFYEEMATLTAHGLLHLFGYDHEKGAREAQIMFGLQNRIVQKLFTNRRNRIKKSSGARRTHRSKPHAKRANYVD